MSTIPVSSLPTVDCAAPQQDEHDSAFWAGVKFGEALVAARREAPLQKKPRLSVDAAEDESMTTKTTTPQQKTEKKNQKTKKKKKPKKPAAYPTAGIRVAEGHLFDSDELPAAVTFLRDHGYVVIKDLMDAKRLEAVRQQLGRDFAAMNTGVDPTLAVEPENKQLPSILSVGIVKDKRAGLHHSRSAWTCRQLAAPVFRSLYQEQDVITSFDGVTFFRPSKKHLTKAPWWHIDSNGNIACTQGVVLLTATTKYTGGLVVLPGSHKRTADVLADVKEAGKNPCKNFLQLDWTRPRMVNLFAECGGPVLVTAPAGSLTLWDSQVVHSNVHRLATPGPSMLAEMGGFSRLGVYVSMLPRPVDVQEPLVKNTGGASRKRKHASSTQRPKKATPAGETRAVRERLLSTLEICNHWPVAPNMKKECLAYPRPASFLPLSSSALPIDTIRAEFGELL